MRRFLITGISAATGVCFAVLAGLSLSAIVSRTHRFHPFSVVIAVVSIVFGYVAFRAATTSKTDEMTLVTALRRGMLGAFVGLLIAVVMLFLFREDTFPYLAHALGNPAYVIDNFRLLSAGVLLGFGVGFVIAMPKHRA